MIAAIGFAEFAPGTATVEEKSFDLAECLSRVRESNQAAARELVNHLYPMVMRIVHCNRPRRMDPEDLAQEIFLKMFARLGQYQGVMPFPNWVSRIAVTTCIDQLRAQKRRPELRWADLSEDEASTLDNVLKNENELPVGEALAARDLVQRLLEQLDCEDRVVLQMLDLERKSLSQISAATGLSPGLVKVRAHRARKKLQKLFAELRARERA